MNGGDPIDVLFVIVLNGKEFQISHHLWRQELLDKAFVLEILHGEVQGFQPVRTGKVRKPLAVLVGGILTDPTQIGKHRKTQGVGVDARIPGAVKRRLVNHGRMTLQELHHETVVHQALVVHSV